LLNISDGVMVHLTQNMPLSLAAALALELGQAYQFTNKALFT